MSHTKTVLSVGEPMIELSAGDANSLKLSYAGDTLNTAWYLRALLGEAWNIAYFTALGTDLYSGKIEAFIKASGIEPRVRTVLDRRPGLYMIHQEHGDRQFTYWRETSAAKLLAQDEALLKQTFADITSLYFSGITLAILSPGDRRKFLDAVKEKRREGIEICFDPNIRPILWESADDMRLWLSEAAKQATTILPTFGDERDLFGDVDPMATVQRYAALGAREIAVKNGKDPAVIWYEGVSRSVPAPGNVSIIDATGAGDSFNGGYLAGRLSGLDPAQAATHAHGVAAVGLGYHGALAPREKLAPFRLS